VSDLFSRFEKFTEKESNGKKGVTIEDKNGYRFSFVRSKKGGKELWRCTQARSKNLCKTFIDTKNGFIICQKRAHTHEPKMKIYKT
jgi:hypothetical protein